MEVGYWGEFGHEGEGEGALSVEGDILGGGGGGGEERRESCGCCPLNSISAGS